MTNLKPGCGGVGEGKELGRVKDSSEEVMEKMMWLWPETGSQN